MKTVNSNDPVVKLLERDETKVEMLENLGTALDTLVAAATDYREAVRVATGVGWPRKELINAGFVDPNKLPKLKPRTETIQQHARQAETPQGD